MNNQYDIVIVGGGMVGTTLALALGRQQYRVALVEAQAPGVDRQTSFDDRAIALSWGSARILNQLGLWPALHPRVESIRSIHVSDRGHFGLTHIEAAEERVPALGYVVTAREIGDVLNRELTASAGSPLTLFRPAGPSALTPDGGVGAGLTLDTPDGPVELEAKLVVAADGAQSTVRQLLGVRAGQTDYAQNAIVANVTPQHPPAGRAFERFTDTGPIALLPMPDFEGRARAALIWTVPAKEADTLMAIDDADFLQRLQARFGYRLGRLEQVGRRHSYPLSLVDSDARTARRTVLLGNAAQSLHPVAGQGFNLALRDTAALLDCLLYPETAVDPGDPGRLARYRRRRRGDQRRVIRFTDTLIKVFGHPNPLLGLARGATLSVLDTLPPLRRLLVRQSMGLNAALPHVPPPPIKEGRR